MKLKYTKRVGGHLAVTVRVPIHLTERDVEAIMDAYVANFGGRRSKKLLKEALHWYANSGINEALADYAAGGES